MKKLLSLLLCASILLSSLCLLTACERSEKIALTSNNYSEYITMNVEITNFRYENNRYYADVVIETNRAANVEFEGVKLEKPEISDALAKLRGDRALGNGLKIDIDYLGVSRTSFTYSSSADFSGRYKSMIAGCKTEWEAQGYVIVSK